MTKKSTAGTTGNIDAITARVRQAVEDIARDEAKAKRDREARDAGLRELRDVGLTMPEIAEATGVNVHTVRLALR